MLRDSWEWKVSNGQTRALCFWTGSRARVTSSESKSSDPFPGAQHIKWNGNQLRLDFHGFGLCLVFRSVSVITLLHIQRQYKWKCCVKPKGWPLEATFCGNNHLDPNCYGFLSLVPLILSINYIIITSKLNDKPKNLMNDSKLDNENEWHLWPTFTLRRISETEFRLNLYLTTNSPKIASLWKNTFRQNKVCNI